MKKISNDAIGGLLMAILLVVFFLYSVIQETNGPRGYRSHITGEVAFVDLPNGRRIFSNHKRFEEVLRIAKSDPRYKEEPTK